MVSLTSFATLTDNYIQFSAKAVQEFGIDQIRNVFMRETDKGVRMIEWHEGADSFPITKVNDNYRIANRKAVTLLRSIIKLPGTRRFSISGAAKNMTLILDETYV